MALLLHILTGSTTDLVFTLDWWYPWYIGPHYIPLLPLHVRSILGSYMLGRRQLGRYDIVRISRCFTHLQLFFNENFNLAHKFLQYLINLVDFKPSPTWKPKVYIYIIYYIYIYIYICLYRIDYYSCVIISCCFPIPKVKEKHRILVQASCSGMTFILRDIWYFTTWKDASSLNQGWQIISSRNPCQRHQVHSLPPSLSLLAILDAMTTFHFLRFPSPCHTGTDMVDWST